jgi:hypothetical protein
VGAGSHSGFQDHEGGQKSMTNKKGGSGNKVGLGLPFESLLVAPLMLSGRRTRQRELGGSRRQSERLKREQGQGGSKYNDLNVSTLLYTLP